MEKGIENHERPTAPGRAVRYPSIARACFHLNWVFLLLWGVYGVGPDALALITLSPGGLVYRVFYISFFLIHFVLISTGIIALFVVIIEVHCGRRVEGFRIVLVALALPILSFLYFAGRYLVEVRNWLEH